MNIYFDENMPFAKEFFSDLGTLTAFSGRDLTAEKIADADVLLVRSITKVNERLLSKNDQLQFVGTATIGVDHIDQTLLAEKNITFTSAPGCNAISVAEYVISALIVMAERDLLDVFSLTVGIVGAGNTGSRLSEKLTALGIKHVLCDPILEKQQGANVCADTHTNQNDDNREYVSLEQALACDVISLHVPIINDGEHPTYHLLDERKLSQLSDNQILINACRGEVIDNQALLSLKQQGMKTRLILDVWENEPNILMPLVEYADIATAHIAGYSLEGKARGTQMLYQALCKKLNVAEKYTLAQFLPTALINNVTVSSTSDVGQCDQTLLTPLVKTVYDIRRDDAIFRHQIIEKGFDTIRKTYPIRREFSAVSVNDTDSAAANINDSTSIRILNQLGFS